MDEDTGVNGDVRYSLLSRPGDERRFAIDPETGTITTTQPLNRWVCRLHSVYVVYMRNCMCLYGSVGISVYMCTYKWLHVCTSIVCSCACIYAYVGDHCDSVYE